MPHLVVVPKSAQSNLARVDRQYYLKVVTALVAISTNPSVGTQLDGKYKTLWSYLVRPYRIIYHVRKEDGVVVIVQIGERGVG